MITSCVKEEKIIEGELFFKLVDFGTYYGAEEENIAKVEKVLDSLKQVKNLNKNSKVILDYFELLERNNLLRSPYIFIKNDSIIKRVFLSENAYERFKHFKNSDLLKSGEKVEVKLKANEIEENLYFSNTILKVDVVKGKTQWKK